MAKKNTKQPARVSHTEILVLAIGMLSAKISLFTEKSDSATSWEAREIVQAHLDELKAKRTILMDLYRIETGNDYGLEEEENA